MKIRALDARLAFPCARCHIPGMTDRPKRPRDTNELAKLIVELATGEAKDDAAPEKADGQRRGGIKGGKARAEKLSPKERVEIARKAAKARWR